MIIHLQETDRWENRANDESGKSVLRFTSSSIPFSKLQGSDLIKIHRVDCKKTYSVVDLITKPSTKDSRKEETETETDVRQTGLSSTEVIDIREESGGEEYQQLYLLVIGKMTNLGRSQTLNNRNHTDCKNELVLVK